eukprot:Ihof_evm10s116 gene=Ihof_evmTU10s116
MASSIEDQARAQVEFYFGDANLSKDRFMKQHIDKDPEGWVDMSVVGGFNRIQLLTTDSDLLAKSLRTSSLLELSSDGTKVRRKTAFEPPQDVDERTIYVENLPPSCDHDLLRDLYSKYGTVTYVSLPRFPNKVIKGFAFVEFSSQKEAQEAAAAQTTHTSRESDTSSDVTTELKAMPKQRWAVLKTEYRKLLKQAQMESGVISKGKKRTRVADNVQTVPPTQIPEGVIVRLDNVNPDLKRTAIK